MNLSALTQTQAAALLSVSPRTMRDWHDIPRNDDGSYSGPTLVKYYVQKVAGSGEYDDQRQRLAAAQAEKVERDNAIRRGEMVEARSVERYLEGSFSNARAYFLGIGSKLGPRLVNIGDPSIIAAAIRAECRAALSELVAYEPGAVDPSDQASEPGVGPPAGPDSEPVGGHGKKAIKRKQRRAGAVADG